MWRALQTAAGSDYKPCGSKYNSVVLRKPGSESWLVYLLSATQSEELVVGRHYRVEVSSLGDQVLRLDPLSKSCFRIPTSSEAEAYVFTQIAAEEPLESSVLLSLQQIKPVVFSVPSGSVWSAERGRLRLLRDGPAN
jgi:hypothetical protein